MKTLRELRMIETNKEATEFGALCKFILSHGGKFADAIRASQEGGLHNVRGLSPRTVEILKQTTGREISRRDLQKTLVNPSALTGSPFQDMGVIANGFVNALQSAGAFDRMLADGMAQIPLQAGSVGSITVGATAYTISEGQMKPISKLSVSGVAQIPQKVHVALVVTAELARSPLLAAGQLIQKELQNAVAVASDSAMIASIIAGVIPASSYGTSAANVRADIEWLLRQVALKQTSRPYLLTTSAIAGTLSQMNNSGQAAFPGLGPQGGEVSPGLPLLVSDAVPAGDLILVDASMIAGASGELALQQLEEGILQSDSTPDSPTSGSTSLQSLWQLNLTGLRLERYLIAQKLTTNAVAIITNGNSYVSANSP